jgi:hypothetical protein
VTTRSGPEPDAEAAGYREQLSQLRIGDTTLPRARFILEQQQAILPDTPHGRGVLRATAEYVCALETGTQPQPEAEA